MVYISIIWGLHDRLYIQCLAKWRSTKEWLSNDIFNWCYYGHYQKKLKELSNYAIYMHWFRKPPSKSNGISIVTGSKLILWLADQALEDWHFLQWRLLPLVFAFYFCASSNTALGPLFSLFTLSVLAWWERVSMNAMWNYWRFCSRE